MSVTSTYRGWVTIDGGPDAAAEHLGTPVARIHGHTPESTLTRWPGRTAHAPDAFPPDPIPEVWLTYPSLAPAARVATFTRRSDLYREDPETQAVMVATLLAHDGLVGDWPEGTNLRTLPSKLRQDPLILGCFEQPAITMWAGPDLAVRLTRAFDPVIALCAPPQVMRTISLTAR